MNCDAHIEAVKDAKTGRFSIVVNGVPHPDYQGIAPEAMGEAVANLAYRLAQEAGADNAEVHCTNTGDVFDVPIKPQQ